MLKRKLKKMAGKGIAILCILILGMAENGNFNARVQDCKAGSYVGVQYKIKDYYDSHIIGVFKEGKEEYTEEVSAVIWEGQCKNKYDPFCTKTIYELKAEEDALIEVFMNELKEYSDKLTYDNLSELIVKIEEFKDKMNSYQKLCTYLSDGYYEADMLEARGGCRALTAGNAAILESINDMNTYIPILSNMIKYAPTETETPVPVVASPVPTPVRTNNPDIQLTQYPVAISTTEPTEIPTQESTEVPTPIETETVPTPIETEAVPTPVVTEAVLTPVETETAPVPVVTETVSVPTVTKNPPTAITTPTLVVTPTPEVSKIIIENEKVTLNKNKFYVAYKKTVKPTVSVTHNDQKLIKNKDYVISYKNNKIYGKGTVTITGIGEYTGIVEKTFYIFPEKTKIKSCKNCICRKQRVVQLVWKKQKGIDGYQIVYSYNKNGKYKAIGKKGKGTTSCVFTFSKKKVYIKIRAYVYIDGKIRYGAYSSAKSIVKAV